MSTNAALKRVAAAMSGGVDSSVAASILVEQGCEVIGFTMQLFDRKTLGGVPLSDRGCCNIDAIHRAEAVCHTLKIPHYTVDLRDDFKQYVITDFITEYINGRTPNPCIRCNTYLKWGSLFKKARLLGCDYLMTGHYAGIEQIAGEYQLHRALDPAKDQSYALWGIPRESLPFTLLPLGSLRKTEVRKIAAQVGLKTANTPESQEICFIPSGHYSDFILEQRPDLLSELQPGEMMEEGQTVGRHQGYIHYTVGQRKGLGGGFKEPHFVLSVEPSSNRVVIGTRAKLQQRRFIVDQLNWLIPDPHVIREASVQVRYRSKATHAGLNFGNNAEELTVVFDEPVEAITPGQSAVFYQDRRVIGGGRIVWVLPAE
ncbi:MAG: tRNA 2-thiouridine(34) synthase MnmA [bacterium]|nr:tRNA 2-thiouridine(34) synthase MnmA [bacterium]